MLVQVSRINRFIGATLIVPASFYLFKVQCADTNTRKIYYMSRYSTIIILLYLIVNIIYIYNYEIRIFLWFFLNILRNYSYKGSLSPSTNKSDPKIQIKKEHINTTKLQLTEN